MSGEQEDHPRTEGSRGDRGGLIGRVVGSVVTPVVDQLDVDDVVRRIDIDAVLDRIDADALLDRIDVNHLLDRVDPDRLLDRVDPDRLLDRVDIDRVLDRVDVNELVERTEIDNIITRSTTGVFTQLLDVARTQVVALDQLAQGVVGRLARGRRAEIPPGPSTPADPIEVGVLSSSERAIRVQGRFAGSVSRFLAFMIDQFLIGVAFAVFTLLVQSAVRVVIDDSFELDSERWLVVSAYTIWAFTYVAGSLAASGRTVGKAVLGVIVVDAEGGTLTGRAAVVRTVVFPLSFVSFGIGLLMGLFRRDRRELHDLIARTAVLYEWDAETARRREEALSS